LVIGEVVQAFRPARDAIAASLGRLSITRRFPPKPLRAGPAAP